MADIGEILAPVADDIRQVREAISHNLRSNLDLIADLASYVAADGKHLRSSLVLLTAKACSYQGQDHIKLGVVVEFIHAASLLHDDVIDSAMTRRGKSTAHNIWGNNVSILTGDFLYSRAFQILCDVGHNELTKVMSRTTNILAEGEVQQMINIGRYHISEAECLEVAERKTAQLFEASCLMGAIVSDSDADTCHNMAQFGLKVGLAFQLVDDLLDYMGGTGKLRGQDLKEGKLTLPLVYAMAHCEEADRRVIEQALHSDRVHEVIAICEKTGAFDYVKDKVNTTTQAAQAALDSLPESIYKDSLKALLQFLVDRKY